MTNPYAAPEANLDDDDDDDVPLKVDNDVPPKLGHPIGFFFFFWGEFAERASYYGMRAILPLYLSGLLGSDADGIVVYSRFKMACYALPLVGGFLADRYFGKYNTIVFFSIPYIIGHFILGIPNEIAMYIALALLAGGSGVIKPNISTLMGLTYDQKRPGQIQLRSQAFLWFYFAINVGALISQFALPMIRTKYGYAIAFQFPTWLMVFSLGIFAFGKRHYAVETTVVQKLTPEQTKEKWRTFIRLLGIFGLIVLWWVPYEHNDVIWVYFARDYLNLDINLSADWMPIWMATRLQGKVSPDQIQFVNALCVMVFAPLFGWLFARFDPKASFFTFKMKILIGFAVGVLTSATMACAGFMASPHARISMLWMVASYVLLTMSEVLVYGTGLELAFAEAPASMKGFVTACFLLTNTVANFINSSFATLYGGSLNVEAAKRGSLSPGMFFVAGGMFVATAMVIMFFMVLRERRNVTKVIAA